MDVLVGDGTEIFFQTIVSVICLLSLVLSGAFYFFARTEGAKEQYKVVALLALWLCVSIGLESLFEERFIRTVNIFINFLFIAFFLYRFFRTSDSYSVAIASILVLGFVFRFALPEQFVLLLFSCSLVMLSIIIWFELEKRPVLKEKSSFPNEDLFNTLADYFLGKSRMPDSISGIEVFDKNGAFIWASKGFRNAEERLHKDGSAVKDVSIFTLYKGSRLVDKYFTCIEAQTVQKCETARTIDGKDSVFMTEISLTESGYVILSHIEQRKEVPVTGQIRNGKKIESKKYASDFPHLTSWLANDFNNILTPIIGHCEMALESIDADADAYKDVAEVLHASRRAKTLIGQLLNYFNDFDQKTAVINITDVLADSLKLLTSSISSDINVSVHRKVPVAFVRANVKHLNQIFSNILSIVKSSMRQLNTDYLVVEQSIIHIDDDETFAKGVYVSVTFLQQYQEQRESSEPNSGSSKNEDRLAKDEFGLSVIAGIVEELGGEFLVDNMPEKGRLYQILLPSCSEGNADSKVPQRSGINNAHILIVDDESQITTMLMQRLGKLGYRVTVANDSAKALILYQQHSADIDLVITDQTMPGMSGTELIQEILSVKNDAKVILMTGYSDLVSEKTIEEFGVKEVVYKPFDFAEFENQIRTVLSSQNIDIDELRANLF